MRQAASYGIGIMAEKAGAHFATICNDSLLGLKTAIEFPMPPNVKEKKTKVKQFMHAKDNAVSALGKIIKFQQQVVNPNTLIPNWLSLLPIKNDVEEAKVQNELLADLLQVNAVAVLGEQYQRFEQVILILADISKQKYLNEATVPKIQALVKNISTDATFGPQFQLIFQNKLTEEQQQRLKLVIEGSIHN